MDNSDTSNCSNKEELPIQLSIKIVIKVTARIVAHQMRIKDLNDLNKLCILCVRNKSTRVVRQNKSMMAMTNKLKEIHVDFWGLHNSPSQFGSIYSAILICEYI